MALPAGSSGCNLRLGTSRMTTKPQPDDVGNADAQVLGVILQFVVEAAINAQAANDAGAIVLISGAICPSGFGDHKKLPVGVADRVLINLQRGALDGLPDLSLKSLGCDTTFLSIKASKAPLEGAPAHGMAAPIEFVQ